MEMGSKAEKKLNMISYRRNANADTVRHLHT